MAVGTTRLAPAGSVLYREGSTTEVVTLLLEGIVKMESVARNGMSVLLGVRQAGDIIGEIDRRPHPASAQTVTAARMLIVGGSAFRRFLEGNTHAALTLMQVLSDRIRESDRRRIEYGSMSVRGRLARLLVELSQRYGTSDFRGSVVIGLPLTQSEIASLIGASPVSTARALQELREAGLVETGRRSIRILDLAALDWDAERRT
ncbi:Crp/Fnr family transcriptional regulator [Actinoplanes xinjiangensis]|uniref:Crp/Fnr family transcriptional regulator n=1 Tax=Actinoplanes xinjiangensis TaxID=512350 RepID=UPI003417A2E4